ncbi:hypothetical protein [Sphingomonas piscis]|uniref:hypothetical protein n=1 Tax=Sphingomonas piscis TaxID=2714943 RepID=UPI0019CFE2A8|nr:hypothetical protein [Sphingomonas piscis]
MKKLLLIAGAAALASTAPAFANQGQGHGRGNGHANHAKMNHGKSARGVVTSDRYGRLYALNSRGTCPPGLARKGNGCMPPGQARKMYNVGDRYRRNFGTTWGYNQIPDYLRYQYQFDPSDRYYYNQGYLYQVDPRTMLIEQVVSALLR